MFIHLCIMFALLSFYLLRWASTQNMFRSSSTQYVQTMLYSSITTCAPLERERERDKEKEIKRERERADGANARVLAVASQKTVGLDARRKTVSSVANKRLAIIYK